MPPFGQCCGLSILLVHQPSLDPPTGWGFKFGGVQIPHCSTYQEKSIITSDLPEDMLFLRGVLEK